jgi:hypothetical protein
MTRREGKLQEEHCSSMCSCVVRRPKTTRPSRGEQTRGRTVGDESKEVDRDRKGKSWDEV